MLRWFPGGALNLEGSKDRSSTGGPGCLQGMKEIYFKKPPGRVFMLNLLGVDSWKPTPKYTLRISESPQMAEILHQLIW